jgi:hypothetical protein
MQTKTFIKMPKQILVAGKWRCGKLDPKQKMTKNSFTFGARNPFILGLEWHWRVDVLDCDGVSARLLVAYHLGKNNYLAWLVVEQPQGTHIMVACLEHHGDHGSWHVHTMCGDIADIPVGSQRHQKQGIRIPSKCANDRSRPYTMGPQEAVNRAYSTFRVGASDSTEEGSLL